MYIKLNLEGPELVEHYLTDALWEPLYPNLPNPEEEWGVIEKLKDEEMSRLNLCELPDTEKFCKDLAAHPQIEVVEQHNFYHCDLEVITFHWIDPLFSEDGPYKEGKFYKFDVWHGPATNYEAIRWGDQPYSG